MACVHCQLLDKGVSVAASCPPICHFMSPSYKRRQPGISTGAFQRKHGLMHGASGLLCTIVLNKYCMLLKSAGEIQHVLHFWNGQLTEGEGLKWHEGATSLHFDGHKVTDVPLSECVYKHNCKIISCLICKMCSYIVTIYENFYLLSTQLKKNCCSRELTYTILFSS